MIKITKTIKRIFGTIGFLVVTLIALAIIVPNLYEDELKALVKDQANKQLAATLDFKDLNLSLLSSFPDLKLSVDQPKLMGKNQFEGMTLFESEQINIDLDIVKLIRDKENVVIKSIILNQPFLNLLADKDGKSNWDIFLPEAESNESATDNINFELDDIKIIQGNLKYNDVSLETKMVINELNLTSSGNFDSKGFKLNNDLNAETMTFEFENITYLNQVKINGKTAINVDMEASKYTFLDNKLSINHLPLNFDGMVDLNDENIELDLKFSSPSNDVKSFLTLIPALYTASLEGVQSSGRMSLEGLIKGFMDSGKGTYPKFDLKLNIDNGMIKYPDVSLPIKDIFTDVHIASLDEYLNFIKIDIPRFALSIDGQPINGYLDMMVGPKNSKYEGSLKGKVNLNTLSKSLPSDQVREMSGVVDSDVKFAFTQNQIDDGDFEQISLEGTLNSKDLSIKFAEYPALSIEGLSAKFSPKIVLVEIQNSTLGQSDAEQASFKISNPLALFATDQEMSVHVKSKGKKINLNEWTQADTLLSESTYTDTLFVGEIVPKYLTSEINLEYDELQMNEYNLKNISVKGGYNDNAVRIDRFSGLMKSSDWNVNGTVAPVNEYLNSTKPLSGNLNLVSNQFVLDDWISSSDISEKNDSTLQPIVKMLPDDMDFKINSSIDKLIYGKVDWVEVRGNIQLVNSSLELRGVTSELLGGRMKLEGIYDEKPANPTFSIKYDASKLKFKEMFSSFLTMRKLAPIAKFIDGVFNTTFVFEGELTDGYMPVWNKLTAAGFLQTLEGAISGFRPLDMIGEKLQIKEFKNMGIKDSKNWFEVVDGRVKVKEFVKKFDDIDLKISGSHAIGNDLDYLIFARVPREKFEQMQAGQKVNEGINWLAKEAGRLGINMDAGDFVNLQIDLSGNILKPKVDLKLVDISGKSLDQAIKDKVVKEVVAFKDSMKNKAEEKLVKVKDSLSTIADEKIKQAKDVVGDKVQTVSDSVKVVIKNKASKVLDSLAKEKVSSTIDTLIGKQGKEKVEEVLGTEVDKVKDKLKDWNPFKKNTKQDTTKKNKIKE